MVQQGDTVQAGQALVRLDTSEVEVKLREARTAVIKAEETLNQFENWDHSPDVTRARRMLTKSRMALDAQKKALDEAERLFGKGIIAANEVESVRQQHASQLLDHQSVEEELAAILARGASTQRQIARLELDTQRQRLRQHEAELAQAVVRSPVAGIVMRPAVSGSNKPNKQVSAGETFGQGELLLAVGDLKGLTVAARVGEVEVTQLKPGQAVTVSGDAFPGVQLHGTLRSVAPQADDTETRGLPVFQIQVSVDELTAAQRQQVWVGMSASLSVQVLKREAALMVPLSAVQQDPSGAWVWVQPTGEVGARKQSVQTGHTTPDSVEITSGLQAGNVVWLGRPNGQIAQQPGQH
jgi:HlyD family secretion protein